MNPQPKYNYIEETKALTKKSRELETPKSVSVCGMDLFIYPNVFDPSIFFSSCWFGEQLSNYAADNRVQKFCEVGTGTGVVGILVALKNETVKTTLCDVNVDAVENAKANVEKHNLSSRVEVVQSDVFSGLEGKIFDAIFWSLPFGYLSPDDSVDVVDVQTFDPGYKAIERYFAEGERYLSPNGTLLFGFSPELGHGELIEQIVLQYGWKLELVAEHRGIEKSEVTMQIYSAAKV